MNDKNIIEHILYNLMFAKPHQISNAEDAYIEYEVRMSKEELNVVRCCLYDVLKFLYYHGSVEEKLTKRFESIAKQNWFLGKDCENA